MKYHEIPRKFFARYFFIIVFVFCVFLIVMGVTIVLFCFVFFCFAKGKKMNLNFSQREIPCGICNDSSRTRTASEMAALGPERHL